MAAKHTKRKSYNTQRKPISSSKIRDTARKKGQVQDEIILVVALVISVLLFLSNFDLSGAAGEYVSEFLFGIIGLEAYILPVVLFFGAAFHISNLGNRSASRKLVSGIVFLIALAALVQLISEPFDETLKITEYYQISSIGRSGGGIIGGFIVMILCNAFDVVATYIILAAAMAISAIVITGKAIFTYIAKKGKNSFDERREYQKLKKEQSEVYGINDKKDNGLRRPPKTFVIDGKSGPSDGKNNDGRSQEKSGHQNRRDKKFQKGHEEGLDDLPIVNLDHLFPEDTEPFEPVHNNLNKSLGYPGSVPTYEDELKSKFGKGGQQTEIKNTGQDFPIHNIDVVHSPGAEGKAVQGSQKDTTNVEQLNIKPATEQKEYVFPPLSLLSTVKPKVVRGGMTDKMLKETAIKLQNTLESFGVHVTITNVSCGPAVTRYELQPEQGVKVKSITSLADDIKLNLAASDIRIEAPIPGKSAVGIEVPNIDNSLVSIREMIDSKEFKEHPSDIAFAVGKDIGGQIIITDIARMPHLLIAGATGSGKSVCINTLIMSILYKSKPTEVRLMMIDPKVVELNVYNGIPHLLIPVVTDPKKASAALNWAVAEMVDRYKKFADVGVRDLKGYNEKVAEVAYLDDENYQKLPQIVIIIDELSDLMMVAPGEVEDAICRLAQMARAAGIHLIIATQRPSVNVITGLIKANIPSRIAFSVSSSIDSRTIIDGSGAEKLLGKGDMLFFPSGYPKPVRIQGTFISDKEVSAVVGFLLKNNNAAKYSDDIRDIISNSRAGDAGFGASSNDRDDYFAEAGKFIIEKDKASIGMLQRVYKIGFNRAARIMDQLAEAGVVGPEEGTKPRKILMSPEQFEQYLDENG